MSKPRPIASDGTLPGRDEIAAFVASSPGKVGKREIARAFGLKEGARSELKRLIRDMEDDGALARHGRRIHAAGALPAVFPGTIIARDRDGDLVAEPSNWDRDAGEPPRITILAGRRLPKGERAAGIGDRVLLRLDRAASGDGSAAGRIVKLLPKDHAAASLGVFRAAASGGGGRVTPVDKKAAGRELVVLPGDEGEAEDGDLVSVSLVKSGGFGPTAARVRERLGSLRSERAVSLVAIHAHRIPHVFSAAALAEAAEARPATLADRKSVV